MKSLEFQIFAKTNQTSTSYDEKFIIRNTDVRLINYSFYISIYLIINIKVKTLSENIISEIVFQKLALKQNSRRDNSAADNFLFKEIFLIYYNRRVKSIYKDIFRMDLEG